MHLNLPISWGIVGCGWVARDYVAPALLRDARRALWWPCAIPTRRPVSRVAPDEANVERHADLDAIPRHAGAGGGVRRHAQPPAPPTGGTPPPARANTSSAKSRWPPRSPTRRRWSRPAGSVWRTLRHGLRPAFPGAAPAAARTGGTPAAWVRSPPCGCTTPAGRPATGRPWPGRRTTTGAWTRPAPAAGRSSTSRRTASISSQTLLGEPLVEVSCLLQRRVFPLPGGRRRGFGRADSSSGALLLMNVAYNCPDHFPRRTLELIGTRAMAIAHNTMGQTPGGSLRLVDARDWRQRGS